MASKKINVSELDFDAIKTSLKEFLKGQDTFQDYDFDGSGLSVLLDILAYNTHYNAIYNNLSINEMFLDSARKRNSVVSLAKTLGYTPRSATCSTAILSMTSSGDVDSPHLITLPAYSPFSTIVNNKSYRFYNRFAYSAAKNTRNVYEFASVELFEGIPLTYKYTKGTGTRYIIPNANVDTSSIVVKCYKSINSSDVTTYTLAESILNVNGTSHVYWVKEIDDGLYELTFGDGNIGFALENGNVVEIHYMVSNLDAANNAKVFTYNGNALYSGFSIPSITTISYSSNGTASENLDSIKFNAPRVYSAQDRAVTIDDYKALIYSEMADIDSVTVWGGEDATPPLYGKIFICIKPQSGDFLTEQQKDYLLYNIIKPKKVTTVTPVIVDAEYINVQLEVTVYYNELETTRSISELQTIIKNEIETYNQNDLQKFDGILRYSKLSKLIDNAESSILNNITTLTLHRKIYPKYNISAQYTISLITPIYYSGVPEDMILSTGFYISGDTTKVYYLVDDGIGNMILFYYNQTVRTVVNSKIGSVDYKKGIINIYNLNISMIVGSTFELSIKPQSNDIVSAYTQIVQIDPAQVNVTVISDKTINGNTAGGTNYIFASSRT
jgi:hypothetical protein